MAAQYGQGMVRPGCWWSKDWAGGLYLDRQYRIATGIYSFHYDINSFWNGREATMEARRELGSLFVATSPNLSTGWISPTAFAKFSGAAVHMAWCPVLDGDWSGADA